jgi:predicted ArsR family transcriptional regulator
MRSVRPSTHQSAVLAVLRRGPVHLDDLCSRLNLRPRQVRTAIDHLRAGGTHVQRVAHKTWRAAA